MFNRLLSIVCFVLTVVCGVCMGVLLFNLDEVPYVGLMAGLLIGFAVMSCGFVYFGVKYHDDARRYKERNAREGRNGRNNRNGRQYA